MLEVAKEKKSKQICKKIGFFVNKQLTLVVECCLFIIPTTTTTVGCVIQKRRTTTHKKCFAL